MFKLITLKELKQENARLCPVFVIIVTEKKIRIWDSFMVCIQTAGLNFSLMKLHSFESKLKLLIKIKYNYTETF